MYSAKTIFNKLQIIFNYENFYRMLLNTFFTRNLHPSVKFQPLSTSSFIKLRRPRMFYLYQTNKLHNSESCTQIFSFLFIC